MSTNDQSGKSKQDAKDLLLEDYRYRAESLWKNEASGETRVNLFIGFVTLVVGALVTLCTGTGGPKGGTLWLVVLASLSGLLVLGIITLARLMTRNENTDRCKRGLDAIRQAFKDHFDDDGLLLHYYPVEGPVRTRGKRDTSRRKHRRRFHLRKFGGLAHTIAGINSLLFGAIVAVAVYAIGNEAPSTLDLRWVYASAALSFLAGFLLQVWYCSTREKISKKEVHSGEPTHAGGVVYKVEDGTAKYLMVTPTDQQALGVLPKGHIKHGEGHGEAALREVREEAGVVARMVCLLDRVEFETDRERVDAKFYLMEYLYDVAASEKRGKGWLTLEETLALLKFEESRHLVKEGERKRVAMNKTS